MQQTANFSVTVSPPSTPPPPALLITPANPNSVLPGETVGVPDAGDAVAVVTGGQAPYSFATVPTVGGVTAPVIDGLPPGMALAQQTNTDGSVSVSIDGTPTVPGQYSFGLQVTDAAGASASLSSSALVAARAKAASTARRI